MNFKKKVKSNLNYLEMTPVPMYSYETAEEGLIKVLVPKFTSQFAKKYVNKWLKYPYIKANLDEFGTSVWLLMNGENKVDYIGNKLTEQFGERIEPVYDRLTLFLTQLYQAGFIKFKETERN